MIIELETERLYLRQWNDSDYQPFAQINSDDRVMAYFPAKLTQQESDATLERCRGLIAERGWSFWAVELKATAQLIGMVGLHIPSAELPFSPCVEVGWRLMPESWGKGLATEAAQAALNFGFTQLNLSEIVAFTSHLNKPSLAVMRRLGMSFSEEFEHPSVPLDSPLRPLHLYRLTKEQWMAHQ